jgi:hypothetical protein
MLVDGVDGVDGANSDGDGDGDGVDFTLMNGSGETLKQCITGR